MPETIAVLSTALEGVFDLSSRRLPGAVAEFDATDVYTTYGDAGLELRKETVRSSFTETVLDGSRVRWTRRATEHEVAGAAGDPPARAALGFTEGMAAEGDFEDAYALVPFALDDLDLPESMEGFLAWESLVHAALFGVFTSRAHGCIDRLRAVGDTAPMALSGRKASVDFGGFMHIETVRGASELTFQGLASVAGRPAALLSFRCPQDIVAIAQGGSGRADMVGQAWVDLDGAGVLWGWFEQRNLLALPLGRDGALVPLTQVLRCELRRASAGD